MAKRVIVYVPAFTAELSGELWEKEAEITEALKQRLEPAVSVTVRSRLSTSIVPEDTDDKLIYDFEHQNPRENLTTVEDYAIVIGLCVEQVVSGRAGSRRSTPS